LDTLKARFLEGFGTEQELDLPPPPPPKPAPRPAPIAAAPPPPPPPPPKIVETERITSRPDILASSPSDASPGAGVAPTAPISDPIVSHTMSGVSRASLASAPPPPAPAPAPISSGPSGASEAVGATRIVTMDEMGGTSVSTGFFSAGDSPATMMV